MCWISLTAASACFATAAAVDNRPPHQLPPLEAAGAGGSATGAFFSDSCSSELVALGVKLAWYDRLLSADWRVVVVVESTPGGGVLVEVRLEVAAVSRTRGVCGRSGAFSPSWFSSSARMSRSCSSLAFDVLVGFAALVVGFLGAVSVPRPSKSSPSSSSIGLEVMVKGGGRCGGGGHDVDWEWRMSRCRVSELQTCKGRDKVYRNVYWIAIGYGNSYWIG